jgi:hypothetical protein
MRLKIHRYVAAPFFSISGSRLLLYTLSNTAQDAFLQMSLCLRMLGLNPRLLQRWRCQAEALSIRLYSTVLYFFHTRLDLFRNHNN